MANNFSRLKQGLLPLYHMLCLTLCNSMDCSLPDSSVYEILQARILEWVAIPFSRGSSHPGIKPQPPELQAASLQYEPPGKPYIIYSSSLNSLSYFFDPQCISFLKLLKQIITKAVL